MRWITYTAYAQDGVRTAFRITEEIHTVGHAPPLTRMVAQSVEALQAHVGTIASVHAVSGSIGQAIIEQESMGGRVSARLQTVSGAVSTLSRKLREAAQIAAKSGMLSEIVLCNGSAGRPYGGKVMLIPP